MKLAPLLLFAVLFCVTVCNFCWYRVKAVLKARGLSVSYLHDHWRDLSLLRELIANEQNPNERARLLRLQRCVVGFLFASLALFAAFLAFSFFFSDSRHHV